MTDQERRYLRIVALWAADWSVNEIAVEVDMSPNVLQTTISRLRKQGYRLPLRSHKQRWASRRRAA